MKNNKQLTAAKYIELHKRLNSLASSGRPVFEADGFWCGIFVNGEFEFRGKLLPSDFKSFKEWINKVL